MKRAGVIPNLQVKLKEIKWLIQVAQLSIQQGLISNPVMQPVLARTRLV